MRRTARLYLATVLATILGTTMTVSVAADGADPEWGPAQHVPPFDRIHELPRTAVFPNGTLVAVWEDDDTGTQDDLTRIFRSTRPPGGSWSAALALPVEDVWNLESFATRPDGSLQIAYGWEPRYPDIKHRVRIWNADGTVEPVGLANTADDYALSGDREGDVVAERLGSYDEDHGFDHVLRYQDGRAWRHMPKIGADPGDTFVLGPGDSVWMAGYDHDRTELRVRRWALGKSRWKTEWSRDYPPGHGYRYRPLVSGLSLAVGGPGRVTLAFQERERGDRGSTVRAVSRLGRSGWSRPAVLQRLAAHEHLLTTAPVVAAAGDLAEVAWTSSAPERSGVRQIWTAQLTSRGRDVRPLATAVAFGGFRELSMEVDLRDDGQVLLTYLQRRDDVRDLVGWIGPHDGLRGVTLFEDAGIMLGGSAFLGPGLAAVVRSVRGGGLLSRVLEE